MSSSGPSVTAPTTLALHAQPLRDYHHHSGRVDHLPTLLNDAIAEQLPSHHLSRFDPTSDSRETVPTGLHSLADMSAALEDAPKTPSVPESQAATAEGCSSEVDSTIDLSTTPVFDPEFKFLYDVPTRLLVHLPPPRLNITRLVFCRNYRRCMPTAVETVTGADPELAAKADTDGAAAAESPHPSPPPSSSSSSSSSLAPAPSLSCLMGASCKFVHADVEITTLVAHPIHVNYAWRKAELCTYDRLPVGYSLRVLSPNNALPVTDIPSELVLVTRGSLRCYAEEKARAAGVAAATADTAMAPQDLDHAEANTAAKEAEAVTAPTLCEMYEVERMCNRGGECDGVHIAYIDETLQTDFKRAPRAVSAASTAAASAPNAATGRGSKDPAAAGRSRGAETVGLAAAVPPGAVDVRVGGSSCGASSAGTTEADPNAKAMGKVTKGPAETKGAARKREGRKVKDAAGGSGTPMGRSAPSLTHAPVMVGASAPLGSSFGASGANLYTGPMGSSSVFATSQAQSRSSSSSHGGGLNSHGTPTCHRASFGAAPLPGTFASVSGFGCSSPAYNLSQQFSISGNSSGRFDSGIFDAMRPTPVDLFASASTGNLSFESTAAAQGLQLLPGSHQSPQAMGPGKPMGVPGSQADEAFRRQVLGVPPLTLMAPIVHYQPNGPVPIAPGKPTLSHFNVVDSNSSFSTDYKLDTPGYSGSMQGTSFSDPSFASTASLTPSPQHPQSASLLVGGEWGDVNSFATRMHSMSLPHSSPLTRMPPMQPPSQPPALMTFAASQPIRSDRASGPLDGDDGRSSSRPSVLHTPLPGSGGGVCCGRGVRDESGPLGGIQCHVSDDRAHREADSLHSDGPALIDDCLDALPASILVDMLFATSVQEAAEAVAHTPRSSANVATTSGDVWGARSHSAASHTDLSIATNDDTHLLSSRWASAEDVGRACRRPQSPLTPHVHQVMGSASWLVPGAGRGGMDALPVPSTSGVLVDGGSLSSTPPQPSAAAAAAAARLDAEDEMRVAVPRGRHPRLRGCRGHHSLSDVGYGDDGVGEELGSLLSALHPSAPPLQPLYRAPGPNSLGSPSQPLNQSAWQARSAHHGGPPQALPSSSMSFTVTGHSHNPLTPSHSGPLPPPQGQSHRRHHAPGIMNALVPSGSDLRWADEASANASQPLLSMSSSGTTLQASNGSYGMGGTTVPHAIMAHGALDGFYDGWKGSLPTHMRAAFHGQYMHESMGLSSSGIAAPVSSYLSPLGQQPYTFTAPVFQSSSLALQMSVGDLSMPSNANHFPAEADGSQHAPQRAEWGSSLMLCGTTAHQGGSFDASLQLHDFASAYTPQVAFAGGRGGGGGCSSSDGVFRHPLGSTTSLPTPSAHVDPQQRAHPIYFASPPPFHRHSAKSTDTGLQT